MLEAHNVTKIFRGRRSASPVIAVDEVSVQAGPGEFVAIVGESGSGKSTLARMLLDLIPATSGSVLLDGHDITAMNRTDKRGYRRQVQAVPAGPGRVAEPAQARRSRDRRGDPAAWDRDRQRHPRQGGADPRTGGDVAGRPILGSLPARAQRGQRQRVLIARALALDPRIIIADEAVSALDASVKAGVLRVMVDLKDRLGVGFVFITHDLPVVKKVADRVYVMHRGKVVEEGPKDRIFDAPKDPYTRTLLAAAPSLTPTT
ncbi:ABC transporter ATP-binding protein [Microbacterium elymi]|uniref:ABC transporter ATP-binding protein n=1 Tax=Microbacterium elymi TaxID=2909587 RepID=A0ABY5NMY0_9MICO|nr:ABC transporter ATP-binding protein [Microbacterium elymi]UUT36466.1 ABC transporter ATP-binding protein [Microbacterium elymi]